MGLTINGETIDDTLIQREAENMRAEYEKQFADMDKDQRDAQLTEWAAENVVERVLLQQEAKARTIAIDPEDINASLAQLKEGQDAETLYKQMQCESDDQLRTLIETSMQTDRLITEIQAQAPTPSDEVIQKSYEENKANYQVPERVSCAHIVKHINWQANEDQAIEEINKAKQELDNGVPFESIVSQVSDCADNGGSLGYITRGQMVEEFEDIVFNLGPGQVSDVFRTRFGYHIATVYDRKAPSPQPLEDVREVIKAQLQEELKTNALYVFIDGLKEKAAIENT
jgi:parvulin-like peptidyl-prolyl isomerase